MPRVIILSSTFLRHHYYINTLCSMLDVVGVWQEHKSFRPLDYAETTEEEKVIADHFARRDAAEEQYFGDHTDIQLQEGVVHRVLEPKSINDAEQVHDMIALKPDVVLVFGTGILHDAIIDAFGGNIINLHLGLSPYYRGSGTNFWPLVNNEPEYVGATLHYLDAGIDTGDIICHVRPSLEKDDGPHDAGCKTIIEAVQMLPSVVEAHCSGEITTHKQSGDGKLYLRKHFNADAVRRLYSNLDEGMMSSYLDSKEKRDAALDLVSLPGT